MLGLAVIRMKYYAILRRQRPNPPSSKTKILNPPSGNSSIVTTRSQAAAARAASQGAVQATRQDRQASDVVTAIVEVPDENTLATTTNQLVPEAENQFADFAERFLAQTQALAGEHVMLKYQQEGLNQAQQTALMAVQGYAESGLKELATRQLVMTQEFQGELAPIRSSLQQQPALLQKLQTDLGAQMKGEVETGLKDVVAHVQQQIEEQRTRRLGAYPSKDVELLVNKSTSAMETRIETLLHRRINELLTSHLDSHSETFTAENVNVLVHKLVDTSVSDLGNRLKQSLDLHLDQIRQKMQHKLDSNPPLHETFTDDIQQLVAQATTRLFRQAESRLQKASTAARADVNLQFNAKPML
ncbi:unnamed protein product [Phytophthora fragariaefolia]|uniref:Unnamed protein product n=1 Tax=Phytophthora fragariaefolia TaxID=1490495 RepID=A0A9W7D6R6_9STRA|nr:unnamed protein product [Phytophthora fragariaefolia]